MRLPLVLLIGGVVPLAPQEVLKVAATVETVPVPHGGDAADDPAIWIHPVDPARSVVLGDDKGGGLLVYALDGKELQSIDGAKRLNNVDVRYGFPLAGAFSDGAAHEKVDLVGVGNATDGGINLYKMNPRTRNVEPAGFISTGRVIPYGSCLYRSTRTGKTYFFSTAASGTVQQWELRDGGKGAVAGAKVREFDVGSTTEGCVADDVHAAFFVAEEAVGIWKYGAEPEDGETRGRVDRCGKGGHLAADVEGLAIYAAGEKDGYLLASSQGNDRFVVYERTGGHGYVGTFQIVDGEMDGVGDTDGIDVTNVALGSAFPKGFFVAQDGHNPGGNQNYKLVPWERIAERFTPPLRIDPSGSPRR